MLVLLIGSVLNFILGDLTIEVDFSETVRPRTLSLGEVIAVATGIAALWFARQRLAVWELNLPRSKTVSTFASVTVLIATALVGAICAFSIQQSYPGASAWVPLSNAVLMVAVALILSSWLSTSSAIMMSLFLYFAVIGLQAMGIPGSTLLPIAQFGPPRTYEVLLRTLGTGALAAIAIFSQRSSTQLAHQEADN